MTVNNSTISTLLSKRPLQWMTLLTMILGFLLCLKFFDEPSEASSKININIPTKRELLVDLCQQQGLTCSIPKEWPINNVLNLEELQFCHKRSFSNDKCLVYFNSLAALDEVSKVLANFSR